VDLDPVGTLDHDDRGWLRQSGQQVRVLALVDKRQHPRWGIG
jgi:hypothetical protein